MAALALRNEERIGLGLALAAHVALVALILLRPATRTLIPPPERMTVTLSDDVGLTSTAPSPAAQAAPDVAPDLGEPAPPEPPQPVVQPQPEPRVAQPLPQPAPRPAPRAVTPPPRPQPSPAPRQTPPVSTKRPAVTQPGASRIGADFLKGMDGSSGQSHATPAAAIGPAVRASLAGAISRQLKPKWSAPSGADAELLVTVLSWNLNRDGSLAGEPQVVSQSGVTPANAAQKARHAEQAIRAVRLAAPFQLPGEYYDAWKHIASFRFDRKLSQ